jgi:hypothetical protein
VTTIILSPTTATIGVTTGTATGVLSISDQHGNGGSAVVRHGWRLRRPYWRDLFRGRERDRAQS